MRKVCFLAVLICFPLLGLSHKESLKMIERFFSYHVLFKQWDAQLMDRMSATFIEQLDPHSMYFYKYEVLPYYVMSNKKRNNYLKQQIAGNHLLTQHLYELGENVIKRARKIRYGLSLSKLIHAKNVYGYPMNFAQLESKIAFIARAWIEQKSGQPLHELSLFKQEQYLRLWQSEMKAFEKRYKVRSLIKRFASNIEERILSLHTLKAFARALDPHTTFFSLEEAEAFRQMLSKEFYGLGIQIREVEGNIVIVSILPGSSADLSGGLFKGDLIKSINGRDITSLTFKEVLQQLSGKKGDAIRLGLIHKETAKEITLCVEKVVMDHERVQSKLHTIKEGDILHLSFDAFYDNGEKFSVVEDVKKVLCSQNERLLGIVIDLRNNMGGFMNQAVDFSHLFMDKGIVVLSEYANGKVGHSAPHNAPPLYKGPIVILTSKLTASAAEVVAAALKEYGIALVIGDETTYGKGSIQRQTVMDAKHPYPYKVTIARYFTISGRCIQKRGVEPHIILPTKHRETVYAERKLKYALPVKQLDVSSSMKKAPPKKEIDDLFSLYRPVDPRPIDQVLHHLLVIKLYSTYADVPFGTAVKVIKEWNALVKKDCSN